MLLPIGSINNQQLTPLLNFAIRNWEWALTDDIKNLTILGDTNGLKTNYQTLYCPKTPTKLTHKWRDIWNTAHQLIINNKQATQLLTLQSDNWFITKPPKHELHDNTTRYSKTHHNNPPNVTTEIWTIINDRLSSPLWRRNGEVALKTPIIDYRRMHKWAGVTIAHPKHYPKTIESLGKAIRTLKSRDIDPSQLAITNNPFGTWTPLDKIKEIKSWHDDLADLYMIALWLYQRLMAEHDWIVHISGFEHSLLMNDDILNPETLIIANKQQPDYRHVSTAIHCYLLGIHDKPVKSLLKRQPELSNQLNRLSVNSKEWMTLNEQQRLHDLIGWLKEE